LSYFPSLRTLPKSSAVAMRVNCSKVIRRKII
jgi:hypothetical protein